MLSLVLFVILFLFAVRALIMLGYEPEPRNEYFASVDTSGGGGTCSESRCDTGAGGRLYSSTCRREASEKANMYSNEKGSSKK